MRNGTARNREGRVAQWRQGRLRFPACQKSEPVERCWVLWIARHVFNLVPGVGVWLRIGARDRKNERRSSEDVIRSGTLIGQRALGIIECQNRIALAGSDLTGEHDVDRRRPAS